MNPGALELRKPRLVDLANEMPGESIDVKEGRRGRFRDYRRRSVRFLTTSLGDLAHSRSAVNGVFDFFDLKLHGEIVELDHSGSARVRARADRCAFGDRCDPLVYSLS